MKPRCEWKMYLDAHTGKLLYRTNLLRTANGRAGSSIPIRS